MERSRQIDTLEWEANKLQDAITVLLTATPPSLQLRKLCEEQAIYLCQQRDRLIAQMDAS